MKPHLFLRTLAAVLGATLLSAAPVTPQPDTVRAAGTNATSHLLNAQARARVAETFLDLVRIPGVSGEEQAIGRALSTRLAALGATNLPLRIVGSNTPANLALVLPASHGMESKPGMLLNAHIDTIAVSTRPGTPRCLLREGRTPVASHRDRTGFGGLRRVSCERQGPTSPPFSRPWLAHEGTRPDPGPCPPHRVPHFVAPRTRFAQSITATTGQVPASLIERWGAPPRTARESRVQPQNRQFT